VSKRLTSDNDKDGHPERFGVSFNRTPPLFWLPYVWSAGGNLVNEARNRCLLNQPASLNGLAFYADLRNRHHVAPRQDESGSATMSDFFLQQKIAMMVSGRWSVPVLREQAKFQWDVVPFPKGTAGSRVGIDASGYAIASATKHPEAAWKLVRHLLSRKAVEDVTASGLIVPARQEVAESRVFLEPGKSPANSKAFLLAMDHGVPTQSVPRWNEVAEVVNLALEPAWDGKKTVADALKNTCTQVDAMLETGS
jgi:multiple sugar transport system substrate-binding protein